MINFEINNDKTKINLDYDFEAYQEIKKVKDALYDINNDEWIIDSSYLRQLIKILNEMNKDVTDGIKQLRNVTEHKTYHWNVKEEQIKTVRIVVKENQKSLSINFDYDPKVLDLIKSLEFRQYNPKNKSWRIQKEDADWLYDKLNQLGYVELSQLQPHTSHNSEVVVSPDDFPNSTITPYEFQINVVNQL